MFSSAAPRGCGKKRSTDLHHAPLLFLAAAAGGALNAVAGGGTFITFPTLLLSGMPPVNANATSTVALWPGTLAGIGAYRRRLTSTRRGTLAAMSLISVAGGVSGAALLLHTPQRTFLRLVPWLLLTATLIFAFGDRIQRALRSQERAEGLHLSMLAGVAQFLVALYGGFFGAGIGMLLLALLAVMGLRDIHDTNALKNLLVSFVNGVAVVTFIAAGAVYWPQAVLMIFASVIGGFSAGHYAQKARPELVRRFVIVVGSVLTVYFFLR